MIDNPASEDYYFASGAFITHIFTRKERSETTTAEPLQRPIYAIIVLDLKFGANSGMVGSINIVGVL
ncbi:MAG: hypothetical protein DHS20C09_06790 [marine bacterium B5-7]|nr:MAG: hypothetical protein DHS20C09_06790 [marine bacterium B5-7]